MIWKRYLAFATILSFLSVPIDALSQNSPFPLNQVTVLQSAAVATGNGTAFPVNQFAVITVQTVIVTTATVAYESSNDGTNFVAQTCFTLDGQTSSTSTSASAIVRCQVNGLSVFRARISSWGSGAVTVTASGTSNNLAVRDQIALSGAITGQLRGTQTTAPTCATLTAGGTLGTSSCVIDSATDSFVRGHVASGLAIVGAASTSAVVRVTFNTAYASAPACVAAKDTKYGYYIYAVTPTTTTADIKIDAIGWSLTPGPLTPIWVAQDTFSLLCAGTQ